MRCPNCNKFVSLEMSDPEVTDELTVTDNEVACTVRIVRVCADCGDELKEATLDLSAEVPATFMEKHGEGHTLEVEEEDVSSIEEGGGRYAKSYFGATVEALVRCVTCDPEKKGDLDSEDRVNVSMSDKVQASGMDELV